MLETSFQEWIVDNEVAFGQSEDPVEEALVWRVNQQR